jgi:hypothetical protein
MDLVERHRRFWKCEPVDRPLVGTSREGVFFLKPFLELGLKDGPLKIQNTPSPNSFLPYYEQSLAGEPLDGDLFWTAKPPRAIPWMEAIVGCEVNVVTQSNCMTAISPGNLPELNEIDVRTNPWAQLMSTFTETLCDHFRANVPVGQTLMRGPADMLAALLGQEFYTILLDDPDTLIQLAKQCTRIWIEALTAQYELIPRFRSGYVAGIMGLWAPGRVAVYQEDVAGQISSGMYRQFFFECDKEIAAAFDYSLIHLHSASLHMLPAVLEISNLSAVNVVMDFMGPKIESLLPALHSIQQAGKALHVQGFFTKDDIATIQDNLSPNGLCIWVIKEE